MRQCGSFELFGPEFGGKQHRPRFLANARLTAVDFFHVMQAGAGTGSEEKSRHDCLLDHSHRPSIENPGWVPDYSRKELYFATG
jgi:hypothetical protein